jgi:hypothetical protein
MKMIFHFNLINIQNLFFQLNFKYIFLDTYTHKEISILQNGLKVNEIYISKKFQVNGGLKDNYILLNCA